MSADKHTPGPWAVGYRAMDIVCTNAKIGGPAKLFDVRGWGYLTGHGGGLGLDADTAYQIQQANARLAAASPDLLECLIETLEIATRNEDGPYADRARAAIAKAMGA